MEGDRIALSGDIGLELAMEPTLLLTELKEVAVPGDIGPAPGLGTAFLGPAPSSSKSFLSSASLCSHFPRTEPTSILFRLLGKA
jgi:hypothetical protein